MCGQHATVRGLLGELISERHQLTIADMEAGLEHLSRSQGTLRYIDFLLVVLEPYRKALETARRTRRLAADLGIPRIYGLGSKIRDEAESQDVARFAEEIDLELIAEIPYDDSVRMADRKGVALIDLNASSPAVEAISRLLDSLERQWVSV